MSWSSSRVLKAGDALGLDACALRAVFEGQQAAGTLPEDRCGLDDVARFILALLAERQACEVDALTFSHVDFFSRDAVANEEMSAFLGEVFSGAVLSETISELVELGLDNRPPICADGWPIMIRVERIGVTNWPGGACAWVALSIWNGRVGADAAISATAFFGEPSLRPFLNERSICADALREFGSRLNQKTAITDRPAEGVTLH